MSSIAGVANVMEKWDAVTSATRFAESFNAASGMANVMENWSAITSVADAIHSWSPAELTAGLTGALEFYAGATMRPFEVSAALRGVDAASRLLASDMDSIVKAFDENARLAVALRFADLAVNWAELDERATSDVTSKAPLLGGPVRQLPRVVRRRILVGFTFALTFSYLTAAYLTYADLLDPAFTIFGGSPLGIALLAARQAGKLFDRYYKDDEEG